MVFWPNLMLHAHKVERLTEALDEQQRRTLS
jgi:hypothetical protein